LHIAQEGAKALEKDLKDSEKARSDAEGKAVSAEDLRIRLNAAKSALSDREEQISQREATVMARLDKQSTRFSSTAVLSLLRLFCLCRIRVYTEKLSFFQQSLLVRYTPGTKIWRKMDSRIPSGY
jgi:hypothetical protein